MVSGRQGGAWMGSRRGFVLSGLATVLPVAKARALPPPLDWSVDSPDSQGISGAALEKVLDSGETVHGLRSLVVVRNGCRQDQRGAAGLRLCGLVEEPPRTGRVGRLADLDLQCCAALLQQLVAPGPGFHEGLQLPV